MITNDPIDERRGCTSASNAEADLRCPGRHQAQKNIPDPPRSADAQYGDAIHAAFANASGNGSELAALTLEQRETYDTMKEIEKKVVTQLFGASAVRLWREERFWVRIPKTTPNVEPTYEHSAKPDLVVRAGPQALIVDYKSLAGEVPESPKNLQLRDAAVLVRGHLVVAEVATVIIQPLATHNPEIALYEKADLDKSQEELFERVRRSNDPASPRIAGDVQCKFCKAKAKCPEYTRWASALVPEINNKKFLADWTGEDFAKALPLLTVAEKYLESIKTQAEAMLAANAAAIPGYYLKPGATRESITNPQLLFDRFLAMGGRPEQFMPCVTVAKGKLKDAVHTATTAKGKALASKLEELLAGIVEEKQNKPSLAKKGNGEA